MLYYRYSKGKEVNKMKKFLSNVITAVSVIFIAWFVLSWVEVCCKNTAPDPQYSPLNLLVILLENA